MNTVEKTEHFAWLMQKSVSTHPLHPSCFIPKEFDLESISADCLPYHEDLRDLWYNKEEVSLFIDYFDNANDIIQFSRGIIVMTYVLNKDDATVFYTAIRKQVMKLAPSERFMIDLINEEIKEDGLYAVIPTLTGMVPERNSAFVKFLRPEVTCTLNAITKKYTFTVQIAPAGVHIDSLLAHKIRMVAHTIGGTLVNLSDEPVIFKKERIVVSELLAYTECNVCFIADAAKAALMYMFDDVHGRRKIVSYLSGISNLDQYADTLDLLLKIMPDSDQRGIYYAVNDSIEAHTTDRLWRHVIHTNQIPMTQLIRLSDKKLETAIRERIEKRLNSLIPVFRL